MKEYKVLQGIINGVTAGNTISLSDEEAQAFGKLYIEPTTKEKETKSVEKYSTKQVSQKKDK